MEIQYRNKLLVTMSAVSKQYETIMNEIDTLKIEENITDIDIQNNYFNSQISLNPHQIS